MIDFQSINAAALSRLEALLSAWLPGGRTEGGEYVCADLTGGPGRSTSVNLTTGAWSDFAAGVKGGDPVALFAAIRGLRQGEAARELAQELGIDQARKPGRTGRRGRVVANYDYHGPDGTVITQVVRWEPKNFTQRRPDGRGGWIPSVKGIELVPYRLPEVIKATSVCITEGEKDADALAALGLTATTCAQGAGKWRPTYNKWFAGKRVCILPDNDDPGRKHAQDVAQHLHGVADVVKIVELPDLPPKGDVSDWLAAGGTVEELLAIVKAAPEWVPGDEARAAGAADDDRQESDGDVIRIAKGGLGAVVDACEAILARDDLPTKYRTFQRGGQLVRVASLPATTVDAGVTRPQGAVVIAEIKKAFILDVLGRFASFAKYDRRSAEWVPADPPQAAAEAIQSRAGLWPMPPLRGVVACPTIRPDGSLSLAPGYDPATGYYMAHGLAVEVPDAPGYDDARAALDDLADLLTGFSFVEAVDYSVALALILTAVARPALAATPLFGVTAPVRGSGKSTLMDIAAVIATGRRSAVLIATADKDELEKRLVGCVLSGDAIINLDNVNGNLKSDLLCQATTAEAVKLRPLGASSQVEVPNSSLWAANGNNLGLAGDLSRRALLCRLDPGLERPEERHFAFDPVRRAMERRQEYVAACLTVLRGYVAAGRPDMDLVPFGSFEGWSGLIRSALVWLDAADPCLSREAVMEDDPEAAMLRTLLAAWFQRFGRTPRTVKEIVRAGEEDESPLSEVLNDIAGEGRAVNARRLGWWLRRQAGRIIQGMKLTPYGPSGSVAQWKVLPTSD